MQLKRKDSRSVKLALSAATATLLSFGAAATEPTEPLAPVPSEPANVFDRSYSAVKKWADFSGELGALYYSEFGRVSALEPSILLTAQFEGDRKWTNHFTIDSLTGASPNGAIPARNAQTFTGPSGKSTYRANPGDTPLDSSFEDTRLAYSTSWAQPVSEKDNASVGAGVSTEYDYRSFTFNIADSHDFNSKNTTVSLGASIELDQSKAVGGVPTPYDTMALKTVGKIGQSKTVSDFLIGLTQVISRRLITQFNYSFGQASGYMNDPYKIVTEVVPDGSGNAGDPTGTYYYEKRPDLRTKNSVFASAKYHLLSLGVVTGSYRYFWDSWGVKSHTAELDYEVHLSETWHAGLDVRYYHQGRADFYRPYVIQGQALPGNASADYRLGDMDCVTVGASVGKKMNDLKNDVTVHLQYYDQIPDGHPAGAFGSLTQFNLAPSVKALIAKAIFTF